MRLILLTLVIWAALLTVLLYWGPSGVVAVGLVLGALSLLFLLFSKLVGDGKK